MLEVFLNIKIIMSRTNRYKGYVFTARVSQVIVNTMKKKQLSELQFAKCLIVQVLPVVVISPGLS